MPVLDLNDSRVGEDVDFSSPFPSSDANKSALFSSLMRDISNVPGVPEGILAAQQATAWTRASQVLMRARFTSRIAGGLRRDWEPSVVSMEGDVGAGLGMRRGLFANVAYPTSDDVKELRMAAINMGLDIAQNALSAIPIVGNILSAAVGFGRLIWGLLSRSVPEQEVRVPWKEYSRDLDEDIINKVLRPMMMGTDWTSMFLPSLDYKRREFEIRKTSRGGRTRAWGVFSANGEPDYEGNLGMMPGMERAAHIIQVAEAAGQRDVTTDVGSFLPSFTQFGTGAWQQVNKAGNPDMYKVRAGELAEAWSSYFDQMFDNAWVQWDGWETYTDQLFAGKALATFVRRAGPTANHADLDQYAPLSTELLNYFTTERGPFFGPGMFKAGYRDPISPGAKYRRVDEMYVLPAIRRLKQRQKSMLARTVVSALVRFEDLGSLPTFAAFGDTSAPLSPGYSSFGEELTDYAKQMREKLLTHHARFELAQPLPGSPTFQRYAPDVEVVDPPYAKRLQSSFGSGLSLRARSGPALSAAPLEPTSSEPEPVLPPGGGPPFPAAAKSKRGALRRFVMPALAGVGVVGGIAAALHKSR